MEQLTVKTDTAGTTVIKGAWELRAGSHSTEEWLDGAADVSYPGGGPDTFKASNSSGANGYDAGPKMALLTMTTGSGGNSVIAVLEGGGIEGFYTALATQVSGTKSTTEVTVAATSIAADSDTPADGKKEMTLTLTSTGVSDVGVFNVMVMYF